MKLVFCWRAIRPNHHVKSQIKHGVSQLTAELIHFPFIQKILYGRSLNLKTPF
ncbi:hypothetical protein J715_4190 [Acinetobacter baumannii 1571545]|nr:hypothetical protein J715_4190 [Acinetobacter baumannii 1571545]